ncbi:unnamed protein product [marine sediment metagenome]|uniref:Uncharacterized protein n=2 Tax=marine sediment metagenome TaxID=412755 RepID=X1JLF3_9ZZZZ
MVVTPVVLVVQQLEVSVGLHPLQGESLQIYNLMVSSASGSEATEVKLISSSTYFGESSETESIVGDWLGGGNSSSKK